MLAVLLNIIINHSPLAGKEVSLEHYDQHSTKGSLIIAAETQDFHGRTAEAGQLWAWAPH